jgi:hypothetical protein
MGSREIPKKVYLNAGIDSLESIPPVYVAWQAVTKPLFIFGSKPP